MIRSSFWCNALTVLICCMLLVQVVCGGELLASFSVFKLHRLNSNNCLRLPGRSFNKSPVDETWFAHIPDLNYIDLFLYLAFRGDWYALCNFCLFVIGGVIRLTGLEAQVVLIVKRFILLFAARCSRLEL